MVPIRRGVLVVAAAAAAAVAAVAAVAAAAAAAAVAAVIAADASSAAGAVALGAAFVLYHCLFPFSTKQSYTTHAPPLARHVILSWVESFPYASRRRVLD